MFRGDVDLENGTPVEVNPSSRIGTRVRKGKGVRTRAEKVHPLIALAGMWKDRPEWKGMTSVEIVAELRRRPSLAAPAKRSAAKKKGAKRA